MKTMEEKKKEYMDEVRAELLVRGIAETDISKVIGKTGFESALNDYPEAQMHYDVEDAVDEILLVAASN